jgi:hypothetical protein
MNISGNNITIQNGVVTVDGVVVDTKGASNINISGCNYLKTDVTSVVVYGDVSSVLTQSGDVDVRGDVTKVQTLSGDVIVSGSVSGDISTMSGDVSHGSVDAMMGGWAHVG